MSILFSLTAQILSCFSLDVRTPIQYLLNAKLLAG